MITRLLIANRGEIAVRVARTAHRLGIATVGVYAEPDRNALHVDEVDVAVCLGGSTPAESYLRADLVLSAALDTGCDAIHPGYGFLAENAAFAAQVEAAGLVWVGPTPEQITLLGDKVAAKQAAIAAGVPTAAAVAVGVDESGAPVVPDGVTMPALVKAAAGGGGRGMRVVRTSEALVDAIAAASREAVSAFGDGTVFIEPYLEHGRHVEVQIMGDAHGAIIHLGERECSIQRRNQKVIEESPSAGIDDATRTRLIEGALALAGHVGYRNAGTVEFLVGVDGTVNFLEVNTRLQVEHPVTEAVTGLDLVELQLRIAAGEPLPLTQADVRLHGHAIEVRVVAEDPAAGWLPSTGTVTAFAIGEGVRVDTGIRAGAEVSSDYDSLLAKVISHGTDRIAAARVLARALRTSRVTGVRTNIASAIAILDDADFLAAATPTSYLVAHPEVEAATGPTGDDRLALVLGVVFATEAANRAADAVTGFAPSGWRNLATRGQRQRWCDGDDTIDVEYRRHPGPDRADVLVGPWPEPDADGVIGAETRRDVEVRLLARVPGREVIEVDGRRHVVEVTLDGDRAMAASPAGMIELTRPPRFADHEMAAVGGGPVCPLPGTVIAVHAEAGASVAAGDLLMVIEAMKMEHKITATADSTVTEVRFAVGDRVDAGDLLIALTASEAETADAGPDGSA